MVYLSFSYSDREINPSGKCANREIKDQIPDSVQKSPWAENSWSYSLANALEIT